MRVLLVGGTPDGQAVLTNILQSDPGTLVLGAVQTGEEALRLLVRNRPDVILMNADTPAVRGASAHQRIMEAYPAPIVLVADGQDATEEPDGFEDRLPGSIVAIVARPDPEMPADFERRASALLQTTRLMAEVKVVRRWTQSSPGPDSPSAPVRKGAAQSRLRVVAIGASTGGPTALQAVLAALPEGFGPPVLIVHHIAPGFLGGLIEWLSQSTPLKLSIAAHGCRPLSGHGYFAPDNLHMEVDDDGRIELSDGEPENGMRPSVSHLFSSVARVHGAASAGVLLTGMGRDGADELKMMRERGAVTFAQDRATSAVYGMPGEAARIGAAMHILSPDQIAAQLRILAGHRP